MTPFLTSRMSNNWNAENANSGSEGSATKAKLPLNDIALLRLAFFKKCTALLISKRWSSSEPLSMNSSWM